MRQARYKNATEFRIVLQIEQLDVDGQVLCTYGPSEPLILLNTNDADQAIGTFEDMRSTLRDEFSEIVDAYDEETFIPKIVNDAMEKVNKY